MSTSKTTYTNSTNSPSSNLSIIDVKTKNIRFGFSSELFLGTSSDPTVNVIERPNLSPVIDLTLKREDKQDVSIIDSVPFDVLLKMGLLSNQVSFLDVEKQIIYFDLPISYGGHLELNHLAKLHLTISNINPEIVSTVETIKSTKKTNLVFDYKSKNITSTSSRVLNVKDDLMFLFDKSKITNIVSTSVKGVSTSFDAEKIRLSNIKDLYFNPLLNNALLNPKIDYLLLNNSSVSTKELDCKIDSDTVVYSLTYKKI